MTIAIERQRPPARPQRSSVWRLLLAAAVALAAINGALYLAAPALYRVDLAKGPYTEANNLELTRVYSRAIPLYQEILERFPTSEYAVLAQIGIANSHKGLGQLATAREQYSTLLATLQPGPHFAQDRYTVLTSLAALYRDSSDVEGFRDVFADLEQDYPESAAVREGRVYLDTVAAATTTVATIPADFPFRLTADDVSLPGRTRVGDAIEVRLLVTPAGPPTAEFSVMTNLNFWHSFKVQQITPNPRAVSDFWGRRAWQFAGIDKPVDIVATLTATTAGEYDFDVDLEQNYDITELGIVKHISVKD
jgi:tetratricopeptide (TPR) repeat protein